MKALISVGLACVVAISVMGCGHSLHSRHRHQLAGLEVIRLFPGGFVGAAMAEAAQDPEPEGDSGDYFHSNGYWGPPAIRRSTRDLLQEDDPVPPFDPHAARSALNGVDVSRCREAGAPVGFGHAKVTINPDGTVSKVVVDAPSGMSSDAAKCLGDRLGAAKVPPFKGSLVTMGTSYRVN